MSKYDKNYRYRITARIGFYASIGFIATVLMGIAYAFASDPVVSSETKGEVLQMVFRSFGFIALLCIVVRLLVTENSASNE